MELLTGYMSSDEDINKDDKNNFRVEKTMILVVCNDANPNIRLGHIGKDSNGLQQLLRGYEL